MRVEEVEEKSEIKLIGGGGGDGVHTYFHSKYGSHPLSRVCVAQGDVAGVWVLHSLSVHPSRARCVGHLQPLAYHSQSHHIVR